jgi:regulator of chromosome condensation
VRRQILAMPGTHPRRRGTALVVGVALLAVAGCSAADRAVLAAPPCTGGNGAPSAPASTPGTVHAWRPHFITHGVPGQTQTPAPQPPPVDATPVEGWTDVVSIASSGRTTFAVKTDGTVWAYGVGYHGMLGDGDPSLHAVSEPQQVPGITDARSVHVVGDAVFVVRHDGTVLGWGDDLLAHGGRRTDPSGRFRDHVAGPIPVDGLDDVVTIAPGNLTAIALRAGGTVAGWGVNLTDVLGDRDGTSLTTVDRVDGVVAVASAGGAVVAVTGDGGVCAWGNNVYGLLGVEPRGGQTGRPVAVPELSGIAGVAGGHDVAYALDGTGAVWAWGRGVSGALGDGDTSDHVSAVPAVVAGLPPARWIGAWGLTGYAIDTGGRLWAWGSSVPLGDLAPLPGTGWPVQIPMPGPVLSVSVTHAIVGPAFPERT